MRTILRKGQTRFCKTMCGKCIQCVAALDEIEELNRAYESAGELPGRRDPDDPTTFALDAHGRP